MSVKETKPLTFFEILGSVLAGALGVQSNANRRRDFTRGNAKHFIVVGILFTLCFVGAVLGVVNLVLA